MSRLKERLRHAKLRTKFLLSFAVIILVTVLMISIVNYIVSVGAIKRNSAEFSEYLLGQIGINLDKRTSDIEEVAFQQFRSSSLSARLSEAPATAEAVYFRDKYINDFLNDLLFFEDYFLSVYILDLNGKAYTIERKAVIHYNDELKARLNPEAVRSKRGRALWFQGDNGTLFMARALYDIATNKYVGTIAVGLESDYIGSIVTNVRELMDGDVIILNEAGEPFAAGGGRSGVARFYLEQDRFRDGTVKQEFAFGGRRYLSSLVSTDYDKWRIVQIIDVGQLTRGTRSITLWTAGTILVSLLVAFLLAVLISSGITRNIRALLQSMSAFTLDVNHQVLVPDSLDEVGMLALRFNSMAEKINDLFNSVYREKLLKQKAEYRTLQFEYKALQAQMNPHFLYNTLESIYSMAKLKGEREIGEMVYLLGRLLRESIRTKGDRLTLREEIEFSRNYLSIHKLIYGDKIEVVYELDDELMGCSVPKFILQPLVENAIVHGIEEKPGKALIRIACRRQEESLLIEVFDNGVGMDPGLAERLLQPGGYERDDADGKHTSVGIISVHKRIRILYGGTYGLTIRSAKGMGTEVLVTLPLREREESADEPAVPQNF